MTGNRNEFYMKAMVVGRELLLCTRVREVPECEAVITCLLFAGEDGCERRLRPGFRHFFGASFCNPRSNVFIRIYSLNRFFLCLTVEPAPFIMLGFARKLKVITR